MQLHNLINYSPCTAILMANDRVALVVNVNTNAPPKGGPNEQPKGLTPSKTSNPFLNGINGPPLQIVETVAKVKGTNGVKDSRFSDNQLHNPSIGHQQHNTNDNGGIKSVKNISPSSGSSQKTSPIHKLVAK